MEFRTRQDGRVYPLRHGNTRRFYTAEAPSDADLEAVPDIIAEHAANRRRRIKVVTTHHGGKAYVGESEVWEISRGPREAPLAFSSYQEAATYADLNGVPRDRITTAFARDNTSYTVGTFIEDAEELAKRDFGKEVPPEQAMEIAAWELQQSVRGKLPPKEGFFIVEHEANGEVKIISPKDMGIQGLEMVKNAANKPVNIEFYPKSKVVEYVEEAEAYQNAEAARMAGQEVPETRMPGAFPRPARLGSNKFYRAKMMGGALVPEEAGGRAGREIPTYLGKQPWETAERNPPRGGRVGPPTADIFRVGDQVFENPQQAAAYARSKGGWVDEQTFRAPTVKRQTYNPEDVTRGIMLLTPENQALVEQGFTPVTSAQEPETGMEELPTQPRAAPRRLSPAEQAERQARKYRNRTIIQKEVEYQKAPRLAQPREVAQFSPKAEALLKKAQAEDAGDIEAAETDAAAADDANL